jgi:hypothetical protein
MRSFLAVGAAAKSDLQPADAMFLDVDFAGAGEQIGRPFERDRIDPRHRRFSSPTDSVNQELQHIVAVHISAALIGEADREAIRPAERLAPLHKGLRADISGGPLLPSPRLCGQHAPASSGLAVRTVDAPRHAQANRDRAAGHCDPSPNGSGSSKGRSFCL